MDESKTTFKWNFFSFQIQSTNCVSFDETIDCGRPISSLRYCFVFVKSPYLVRSVRCVRCVHPITIRFYLPKIDWFLMRCNDTDKTTLLGIVSFV